jgi:putative transposase
MLSKTRDKLAAKAFFDKAIGENGVPEKINMDKSGANKAGIDAVNFQRMLFILLGFPLSLITVRQVKYLNNIIEQEHRGIKRITDPMMVFKAFHSAEATLAGIELHCMVKKGQHTQSANQSVFEEFYALAG